MNGDHPTPTAVRTIGTGFPGASRSRCVNAEMDTIRDLGGNAEVETSILLERIVPRNQDVPMLILVDALRSSLHSTDDSSHKHQMMAAAPESDALECNGPSRFGKPPSLGPLR